jgi:DNA polymerase III delta prime subunit
MVDNNVWLKKYEPKELNEMILHPIVRNELENVQNNPQHLILYGSPGVGKGTFTNIFLAKTGADLLWVNASDDTGIGNVREKVKSFATAGSPGAWFDIDGLDVQDVEDRYRALKVVVFNEAENLSPEAEASLRELMETVEKRCKFIFMTNNIKKIDKAIKSRCLAVEITDPPINDILKHMEKILDEEGVSYEEGTLQTFAQDCYPDIRKTINEIKGHCNDNHLQDKKIKSVDETVNSVLLNLRLHMTFYNLNKKEMFDQLKDGLEGFISERQFYYLLSGKNSNKVGKRKKSALVNHIQRKMHVKQWHSEYLRMNE